MLKIDHLRKNYGSFALDCSLEVQPGCITGLIGQNGAGKSTTFKAVLGLISTDGGNIRIFGKDLKDFSAEDKQKLGVVLSDSGFSGYLTIEDIIPVMESLYPGFDEAFFKEQVKRFQLPKKKRLKDFSTGMKAKLKVLVAISHNAKLLILDEPTAGLDVVARDELLEMLREFMERDEERSILISSHISSDLETLCDDLYMIHEGKIILHEDTDVLLSDYGLLKVDRDQYAGLDKGYILRRKEESYGYSCLTDQKQYYLENYPGIAIEKGNIDEVITMMISLFSVSTISYDELDNGNAFLFSLPITRKTYAVEKYCFGLIMGLGAWLAVSVLATAAGAARGQGPVWELAITAFIVLPLVLFMLAVMVPVMLKFGAEKGRIAVVICFAVVYLTIALLAQSAEQWGKDFLPLLDSLPEIGIGTFLVILAAVTVLILLLSVRISIGIIKKKEF